MINLLSLIACILGMISGTTCAIGWWRSTYILGIINGFIFCGLNGMIAAASPDHFGVALMIIPSAWMIVTSIFGLLRLKKLSGVNNDN